MGVTITRNYNGFLSNTIGHASKSSLRVFQRHFVRFYNIKTLLQIHASTKRFLSCLVLVNKTSFHALGYSYSCKDRTAQFWLSIIPLPQGTQFDCSFHRQTIHKLGTVDGDEKDMFRRK
jgi:hypothetical protein